MKDFLLDVAQVTVVVFYIGVIFAIAQGIVHKFQQEIARRKLQKALEEGRLIIGGGAFGLPAVDCKVPVKDLNEARVKGEHIEGIHDPKVMEQAGMKPVEPIREGSPEASPAGVQPGKLTKKN